MKIAKKLSLICVSVIISAFTASCRDKTENINYNVIAPIVNTSDGQSFSVNCRDFYYVKINDENKKYAEKICKSAGSEISEDVFNSAYFGENIFGVGLASVVYFEKYADYLSENEWEILCSIAETPEKYSGALYNTQTNSNSSLSIHAPMASRIPDSAYFDAMIEEIVSDLMEQKNYSRNEAFKLIYSEGVTINSPYSPEIQKAVDEVYSDNKSFAPGTDNSFPQSACIVMDYSGGVAAAAGGNNNNTAYNRAYRVPHPLGSSIKPLAVYTPAVENGMISFSSLVPDVPLTESNDRLNSPWPSNYNGVYDGEVTVTYALRQSKNTVPVWLAENLGTENCLKFLEENLKFSTLTEEDNNSVSMAMGYLSQGVSLPELTAAYGIFGNKGIYYTPRFYDEVLDGKGNVIISKKSETNQAVSPQTAWIMNRLLRYNISGKNAIASAAQLENGTEVIGKTGTMNNSSGDDTEKIFVGATPEYVAAVWVGFDVAEKSISDFSYIPPTEIWKNIMSHIPCKKTEFDADETVICAEYCTVSGGLAGDSCPEKEIGYYAEGTVPSKCTIH